MKLQDYKKFITADFVNNTRRGFADWRDCGGQKSPCAADTTEDTIRKAPAKTFNAFMPPPVFGIRSTTRVHSLARPARRDKQIGGIFPPNEYWAA